MGRKKRKNRNGKEMSYVLPEMLEPAEEKAWNVKMFSQVVMPHPSISHAAQLSVPQRNKSAQVARENRKIKSTVFSMLQTQVGAENS